VGPVSLLSPNFDQLSYTIGTNRSGVTAPQKRPPVITNTEQFDSWQGLEVTLPSSWYLEEAVFDLEREHIFCRDWVCVGREEELPQAGDHKILDVVGESIILLRNTEGALRAFYNVCRHRGARICPADPQQQNDPALSFKGGVVNRKVITCPYHAWTYDLDGQLLRAPHISADTGFRVENVHYTRSGSRPGVASYS